MDCSTPGLPVRHQLPKIPEFTSSQSLLKLMSTELVMPSNHLILCYPLLLLPSIFPSIRVFSNESVLCIRWPKYWSFSFSVSSSNEYSADNTTLMAESEEELKSLLMKGKEESEKVGLKLNIQKTKILRRKVMTNLDSILKSKDITLLTKFHLIKAMVFPVVTYGCESWTIKKAECLRTEAFELWCWRKLLGSPFDSKEIQPVHPKGNQP